MNKDRRGRLEVITASLQSSRDDLMEVIDEEQSALDNLPENLQCSQRADDMMQYIDDLQQACDDLDDVCSIIEDVCDASMQ